MRIKECADKPSKPFTKVQLLNVLKKLKNKKARDPWGLVSELFKPNLAGKDLIDSLLLLFNGMKKHKFIPDFLLIANISSIYKKREIKTTSIMIGEYLYLQS